MADVLSIVWFTALGLGLLAGLGALTLSRHRHYFLLAAGSCFAVTGILGLASIGILFIGLSAGCFILASRCPTGEQATPSTEPPPPMPGPP